SSDVCSSDLPSSSPSRAGRELQSMSPHPSRLHSSWFGIDFCSSVLEFLGLFSQSLFDRCTFFNSLLRCIFSDVFGYFHAAEMRSTHRAEVCRFRAFLRKRFVVEFARGFGIE